MARADLGDLRVLNGQGEVVPQHLELPSPRQTLQTRVREAKVFPLYGTRESDIEAIVQQAPQRWQQERLTITTRERITRHDEVLRGYLLQLDPQIRLPARRLLLDWPVDTKGFVQRMQVESSNDLDHWRLQHSSAVIADLHFAGERLLKQDIPLDNLQTKYLRLTPAPGSAPIELEGVRVEYAGQQTRAVASRLANPSIQAGERAGEYRFELPGPLPVTQMDVLPAEMNTFLRATLYARADQQRPWSKRGSGVIYKLATEGEALAQTTLRPGMPMSVTGNCRWMIPAAVSAPCHPSWR